MAIRAAAMLIAISLVACVGRTSQTPTFYHLSAIAPEKSGRHSEELTPKRVITIRRVSLPDYLQHAKIVTRSGDNQLSISEFHRWAGSLENQIERTVARNIERTLDNTIAVTEGSYAFNPDVIIELEFEELSGQFGGELELRAKWYVETAGADERKKRAYRSAVRVAPVGNSYPELISAHNDALAQLSSEIARQLADLD